jgi:hypothetical protein
MSIPKRFLLISSGRGVAVIRIGIAWGRRVLK